jgi:hypothetical protein
VTFSDEIQLETTMRYKGAVQTVIISDETKLTAFFVLTLDRSVLINGLASKKEPDLKGKCQCINGFNNIHLPKICNTGNLLI